MITLLFNLPVKWTTPNGVEIVQSYIKMYDETVRMNINSKTRNII